MGGCKVRSLVVLQGARIQGRGNAASAARVGAGGWGEDAVGGCRDLVYAEMR